ncbi:MAG: right-handed parallel beta-helix repeat-containing protein [Novosphingobium sp.]
MIQNSGLPPVDEDNGNQKGPAGQANATRRTALGALMSAVAMPYVNQPQGSAAKVEVTGDRVYPSSAAGLAATTSGQSFSVYNGDGTVTAYLNSAGVAVAQRTLATTEALTAPTGAKLVGFAQPDSAAVLRDVMDKLRETVSVKDFGVPGVGATNDTAAVTYANRFSLTVVFPAGGTYNLQNWIPRAGTRIIATGATINRYDDTTYGNTGSSAAVIITNDDIEIIGGTWGKSASASKSTSWTGSVVVENGSAIIRDATFKDTWGAVFGHTRQNGSKVCSRLLIEKCTFHNNSHNTYLADINNFSFINNHSRNSDRDGLRTYRNVANLLISGNHIYNNGSSASGQSQDGMDLFYGGKRCIITGNYVYGNFAKGIDIKRGSASAGETVFGEKFIISNNHIFNNRGAGIEIEQSLEPPQHNRNIQISGNQIYENGMWGILSEYARNIIISGNQIYDNARGGIRLDYTDVGQIQGNTAYDNVGPGILVTGNCSNVSVHYNTCYDSGVGTQTGGIHISCSGSCSGNTLFGNTNYQIATAITDGSLKGERLYTRIVSTSGRQYIGTAGRACAVSGAKLSVASGTTLDFLLGKQNSNTGANSGTVYSSNTEELTENKPKKVSGGKWSSNHSRLDENELVYISINRSTTDFTMGLVELEIIT